MVGALVLAATISSSLIQPAFGLWSDRVGALWLIPAGALLAGVGIGLAAVAPSYPLVLLLVFASGIGVAAFHPEATKFAALASGLHRARGMSYFNIGGNAGYALAPILITPLVLWLGVVGGLVAALPVVAYALFLWLVQPRLRVLETGSSVRVFDVNGAVLPNLAVLPGDDDRSLVVPLALPLDNGTYLQPLPGKGPIRAYLLVGPIAG